MSLPALGAPAPRFKAQSPDNPSFAFDSLGGRFVLLAFPPSEAASRNETLSLLSNIAAARPASRLVVFAVVREPPPAETAAELKGLRWFFDAAGEIADLYRARAADGSEQPRWVLIDPSLRVFAAGTFEAPEQLARLLGRLPAPADHAGVPLHAPVLIAPRIFEPELCRRLIAVYDAVGGRPSGVMRDVGGKTVGVLDDFKSRRDADVDDPALRAALRARVMSRLLPEIEKAFMFKATRMERYIVACYDAEEGGYFRPHRDNTTLGTAHRQFACSINLNAEEFEGGDLRFPEFGSRTYRPPTGGAVVFSCALLHEATRVTRGRRYAFLPFFYDEAAASVRAANLHHLAAAASSEAAETAPQDPQSA